MPLRVKNLKKRSLKYGAMFRKEDVESNKMPETKRHCSLARTPKLFQEQRKTGHSSTFHKLTNLKLDSSESIRDYLVRAEELQLNLSEVNENVNDQMLCSVVLKGHPQQFANFVTVFKYWHALKSFFRFSAPKSLHVGFQMHTS